jgi:murein DD-endopeptidase MepM/ murein hydrolase activator NlpD
MDSLKKLAIQFIVIMAILLQPFFVYTQESGDVVKEVLELKTSEEEVVTDEPTEEEKKAATVAEEARARQQEITTLNSKIEEKRKKVEQLEQSIAVVKKDISRTKLQKVSFQNQIAILSNRQTQTELDIEATQEKIDTLDLEIQAFSLEIDTKQANISRQKTIIAEFIRTLHYENDKSYLEILASYENFSEFYNRLQYLQSIESDIGKSARGLRLAKVEIEEKKDITESRQESYEDLRLNLQDKQKNLNEQIFAKDNLLVQTKSSEARFQTLLQNLRNQYQQIENEISQIEKEVRERLQAEDRLSSINDGIAAGKLSWPTQSRYVTARFHDPDYPYRHIFEHNAIDIRSGQGTAIRAAATGYVARARRCSSSSCYAYVMIIHSAGISTLYGHVSKIFVNADQFVTRGDVIALSGGTPRTVGAGPFVTGPHLHFEVRKNGIPVNPLTYLIRDY